MTTIKKDQLGLYLNEGGWKCRCFTETRYKEGDEVRAYHFGGSTRDMSDEKISVEDEESKIEWYKKYGTVSSFDEYCKIKMNEQLDK